MSFLKKLINNREEQKDQEEQEAQKYILTYIKTLQQTSPTPVAELAHDLEVIIEQKSCKATLLWQKQKKELIQAAAEEAERVGRLEAWRLFCENNLSLQAGKYVLQLGTDREDVTLTVDPNVPELITGTFRDGRTATTKLKWKPRRWLNLIEQELTAHPEATRVSLDEALSFGSVKLPKEILLAINLPLTFIFK